MTSHQKTPANIPNSTYALDFWKKKNY